MRTRPACFVLAVVALIGAPAFVGAPAQGRVQPHTVGPESPGDVTTIAGGNNQSVWLN